MLLSKQQTISASANIMADIDYIKYLLPVLALHRSPPFAQVEAQILSQQRQPRQARTMSDSRPSKIPRVSRNSTQSHSLRRRGRGIFKYSFSSIGSSATNLIPIHGFDTPEVLSATIPRQNHVEATRASQSSSRREGEQSRRSINTLEGLVCNGNIWVVLEAEMENSLREAEKLPRIEDTEVLRRGADTMPTSDTIECCKRIVAQWRV